MTHEIDNRFFDLAWKENLEMPKDYQSKVDDSLPEKLRLLFFHLEQKAITKRFGQQKCFKFTGIVSERN